jgi:HAMP domain-containing protein
MNTLRNRLFASYLAVLFIALTILAFVLIGFLQTREVPPEFTWQRLELLLSGFASQQFAREILQARFDVDEIKAVLDEFAEENNVRVLLIIEVNAVPTVLYDSADVYAAATAIDLRANPARQRPQNGPQPAPTILTGRFVDADGVEWLYTGFQRPAERQQSRRFDNPSILLAQPASSETLSVAWAEFSDVFLAPILRSACISGVAAFIFAIFISRSIVRPLQALAKSAQEVAKGQFSSQVPETGPNELKQVASAFNRMTGEVRSAQESQREFLANVSHDLKTPLTSIQGY